MTANVQPIKPGKLYNMTVLLLAQAARVLQQPKGGHFIKIIKINYCRFYYLHRFKQK